MAKLFTRFRKLLQDARALLDESALRSQTELSKLSKFAHFCVMVWRSFNRNRCPIRAAALAYLSLLGLVPMLAVVVSITSSFLKKEGERQIDDFIVRSVLSVMPRAVQQTNELKSEIQSNAGQRSETTNEVGRRVESNSLPAPTVAAPEGADRSKDLSSVFQDEQVVEARKSFSRYIHQFIRNTRSGTLGATGSVALIFVAIGLLTRIEDTFNDIWGVARGRNWFTRIVLYWGVIALLPVLLATALGLASGPYLEGTKKFLTAMPFLGSLTFQVLPVVVLCLTLALFYMLMPNTKVQWWAALPGGLIAGILWHLLNLFSVMYVSRVVSNNKIYGSLGLIPVFMMGLYTVWLILLFGAQVAYAFQNRRSYLEEKQIENINQRGREFVALRLMTCVGQRFVMGATPPQVMEMGERLCVPTRLVQQIMQTLTAARLVVEAAGNEPAYLPARPLETITCHDILLAMRASQGQELATRDEPERREVYGEFERIEQAEREVASSVTMRELAERAERKRLGDGTE